MSRKITAHANIFILWLWFFYDKIAGMKCTIKRITNKIEKIIKSIFATRLAVLEVFLEPLMEAIPAVRSEIRAPASDAAVAIRRIITIAVNIFILGYAFLR
jgi:hypothetical protein